MPESSSSSSSAQKRACDACHRRKVKCIADGTRPCKNCASANLTCTWNAVPQKKGPKGSRAKVISELRESQRQAQLAAEKHEFDSPPGSPAHSKTPGLLSSEMITTCVDYFFDNLYPTQPILHRQKVDEIISQMETNPEAYCLIVALCAYMMIQPNIESVDVQPVPAVHLGHTFLQEAIRVRKSFNYAEDGTVWSVVTSFFFFGSYFCLDRHNTAWFHLREATTLAQIMGMQDEATYKTLDVIDNSRRRRLYWLLFVTERAYALQQHRPLTLYATINLPNLEEDPSETVQLNGFVHLVNLFRPFDDTFVGLWNKARVGCTTEWLARVQQQLSDALPLYLQSTQTQAVDLKCSQQWLRTMAWQLSISHGFLSSAASDNAMSFKFPIEISRDLLAATSQFSQQDMEVHGIGLVGHPPVLFHEWGAKVLGRLEQSSWSIRPQMPVFSNIKDEGVKDFGRDVRKAQLTERSQIEKLFDVACTLTDVISFVPYEQHTFEYGPRDYLNQLMTLISSLRGGQQRFMPLLISKINDTMPNAPDYAFPIPTLPGSSRASEYYAASPGQSNSTSSSGSTPVGSPPMSAVDSQPHLFGAFQQEVELARSLTSASFADVVMTTSVGYGDMIASSPMEGFHEPAVFERALGQMIEP